MASQGLPAINLDNKTAPAAGGHLYAFKIPLKAEIKGPAELVQRIQSLPEDEQRNVQPVVIKVGIAGQKAGAAGPEAFRLLFKRLSDHVKRISLPNSKPPLPTVDTACVETVAAFRELLHYRERGVDGENLEDSDDEAWLDTFEDLMALTEFEAKGAHHERLIRNSIGISMDPAVSKKLLRPVKPKKNPPKNALAANAQAVKKKSTSNKVSGETEFVLSTRSAFDACRAVFDGTDETVAGLDIPFGLPVADISYAVPRFQYLEDDVEIEFSGDFLPGPVRETFSLMRFYFGTYDHMENFVRGLEADDVPPVLPGAAVAPAVAVGIANIAAGGAAPLANAPPVQPAAAGVANPK